MLLKSVLLGYEEPLIEHLKATLKKTTFSNELLQLATDGVNVRCWSLRIYLPLTDSNLMKFRMAKAETVQALIWL